MQEPCDFRTTEGLSVNFEPINRAENKWSAVLIKTHAGGKAVWIDMKFEELKVLKRELDKFLCG